MPADTPTSSGPTTARTVTVRLFGPQARLAETDAVTVAVPDDATVADLRAALVTNCESLRASLGSSRFAVDHEYVADGDAVPLEAEVALIGLVSGG